MTDTLQNGPSGRLAGLDHLRAFAIIFVFFFHYHLSKSPGWINAIGDFGWTGVDLFFVLSGYLIGGQLLGAMARNKPRSFRQFYLKRFFRIIPAYAVVLILYFMVPVFRDRPGLPPLWKFITFTQNFGLDLRTQGAFSHAWSLCIEEQFYLLLPFVISLFAMGRSGKKSAYFIVLLFLAGIAIRWYSYHHLLEIYLKGPEREGVETEWYTLIYYPTYSRLDGLLCGVALAAWYHFRPVSWQKITGYGNRMLLFGLALLTAAWLVCREKYSFAASVFGFPLVDLAYGVIVLAALSPTCFLYRFDSRVTRAVAAVSYSVYLTHKQMIHLVKMLLQHDGIEANGNVIFCLCVLGAAAGGLLLYMAIERPLLAFRRKLLSERNRGVKNTGPDYSGS